MNVTPLPVRRGLAKDYPMGTERVTRCAGGYQCVPGRLLALRRPIGRGKTTLINLLGLLDVPDQGPIAAADGLDTRHAPARTHAPTRARERFGF